MCEVHVYGKPTKVNSKNAYSGTGENAARDGLTKVDAW